MTLEQLKQRLLDAYDPDDLVNELGVSTERLLKALEDEVEAYWRQEHEEKSEDGEDEESSG